MNHFQQLGLPDWANKDKIKETWRRLASVHHPDKGGDADTFHRLKQAYEAALTEATAPVTCTRCQGLGKVPQQRGWTMVMVLCPVCLGAKTFQRSR